MAATSKGLNPADLEVFYPELRSAWQKWAEKSVRQEDSTKSRAFYAAARLDYHEHESVISFLSEDGRDDFVAAGGGDYCGNRLVEARTITEDEAAEIGVRALERSFGRGDAVEGGSSEKGAHHG